MNTNELKKLLDKSNEIKNNIKLLEDEYHIIQTNCLKKIIQHWISQKDFHDYCLFFRCSVYTNEKHPVYMSLECFLQKTKERIAKRMKDFNDLLNTYSTVHSKHFTIEIDDYTEFYASDFDYGFKFKYFDPEKIKNFAKDFNLKIKLEDDISIYDMRIEELINQKNNIIKYKNMLEN